MSIFDRWEAERMKSTMQALQDENARLRREAKLNGWLALSVWAGVALILAYQTWGKS